MGFRWNSIPTLRHAVEARHWPLADFAPEQVRIISSNSRWQGIHIDEPGDSLRFEPHKVWKGHIEL
jgi:hypothetical protein